MPAEKAYAYATRRDGRLLVFEHRDHDAGLQVPKGSLEPDEDPRDAVVRELHEEAGVESVRSVRFLAADEWDHPCRGTYHRHFFHVAVAEDRQRWEHAVTGGGEDDGLVFVCRFVDPGDADLTRDMDDYLDRLP